MACGGHDPEWATMRSVRVLAVSAPYFGHLLPVLSLARALVVAGHEVTVASSTEVVAFVERAGFPAVAALAGYGERQGWVDAAGDGGNDWRSTFVNGYTGPVAWAAHEALASLADRVRPDIVVHECYELAAPVLARERGVACATVGIGCPLPAAWRAEASTRNGWDSDGRGDVYLETCPPVLLDEDEAEGVVAMRPVVASAAAPARRPPRSAYVTLGTIDTTEKRLGALLAAVRPHGLETVASVGPHLDPAAVAAAHSWARVVAWEPTSRAVGRADVVVCHGGAGTVFAALAAARRLVLVPFGSDQFAIAERCARAGLAEIAREPGDIAGAVAAALTDDDERDRRLDEAARAVMSMPAPSALVARLEAAV